MSNKDDKLVTWGELWHLIECHGAVPGRDGCDGRDGHEGQRGLKGVPGDKGEKGKEGAAGREGREGKQGPIGPAGKDGCDGRDGRDGQKGDEGCQGIQGPAGKDGKDGRDGIDGKDGAQGPVGPAGADGKGGTQIRCEEDANEIRIYADEVLSCTIPKPEDGSSSTIECVPTANGYNLIIDGGAPKPITNGKDGADGAPGTVITTKPSTTGVDIFLDGVYSDTVPAGSDGAAGTSGSNGADGVDGISPTITCAQPSDSSLVLTITDVNGSQTKTLDVGAGGSTGLSAAEVTALIEQLRCCNQLVNTQVNADDSITYSLVQTNGTQVSWTSPAPSNGGGSGLTEAEATALIEQLRCCNGSVTSTTNADGSITYSMPQTNGTTAVWTSPVPSSGGGLTQSEVTMLIEQLRCCNQGVTSTTNADGSITYSMTQTNGSVMTWTSPVPSSGGGLTESQVNNLIMNYVSGLRTRCIEKADGSGFDIVLVDNNNTTVVDSLGGCTWPTTTNLTECVTGLTLSNTTDGNGNAAIVASLTQENCAGATSQPLTLPSIGTGDVICTENYVVPGGSPCQPATRLQIGNTECLLKPYEEEEVCKCFCTEVTAGANVTVTLSPLPPAGFNVDWGDGTLTDSATTQSNTYAQAGTYQIRVCQEDECDTNSYNVVISGASNIDTGCCE